METTRVKSVVTSRDCSPALLTYCLQSVSRALAAVCRDELTSLSGMQCNIYTYSAQKPEMKQKNDLALTTIDIILNILYDT